ncbi:MAG: hypothetical protein QGH85_00370 [Candidatus Pacebacteria bacterium]|jgi:predicted transcriptional regulator with HTH domain|nr:hypothetical protein [Parcubacteria group bacterium]MDP6249219.1 hypothetical protein [Candidatus Paceibacterota bacterium]MDP7159026.1 hypothetical protein [Candidatus Paceibacterota bacterium]MDP7366639.1 hypothetical protein [Candidatus Paceibacterota bacterium]MDP7466077.1 hypothetical protein [Candidatus Paceibacterota bacterium]|tara:strand:+ start:825 stop:1148 length:324 start_codon:yes stop_codon:yes gene_type:complete
MRTQAVQINKFEKRAFVVLVFIILILFGLYLYFISKSIVNVIVREEINSDVAAVSSTISELETRYIAHKEAIDIEFAKSAGFKILKEKKFVAKKSLARKGTALNLGN